MANISSKPFVSGKTKNLYNTTYQSQSGHPIIAFEQKGDSVRADGTSVQRGGTGSSILITKLVEQNNNIFSFLGAMGINTTYFGRDTENPNILLHEKCEPLLLEFVYRGALCDASSIIKRQPEKYGLHEENGYSADRANRAYFNEDGTVIPFAKPVLETFHKKALIEKPDGTIDLVFEKEAKQDERYFKNDKVTQFMHEDPYLVTPDFNNKIWYVFNQKKSVNMDNPLAIIDRDNMALYHPGKGFIRKLDKTECIHRFDEQVLQLETLKIMKMINMACRNTNFKSAEFKDGQITLQGNAGWAFVIDGKCEFGITPDGRKKLTDDMVSDNMRWAFNGVPTLSLKRMFQNYESFEQKLLIASMVADGTRGWKDPRFVKMTKERFDKTL